MAMRMDAAKTQATARKDFIFDEDSWEWIFSSPDEDVGREFVHSYIVLSGALGGLFMPFEYYLRQAERDGALRP